jgi:hypothetical protein
MLIYGSATNSTHVGFSADHYHKHNPEDPLLFLTIYPPSIKRFNTTFVSTNN